MDRPFPYRSSRRVRGLRRRTWPWEGRDPAAVLEPGVPSDMVDVKMGAHHIVDLIDRDTGVRRPFLEAVGVHHVPEGTRRAWLVISDATVDQDVVVRGLQQVGLDAEHELPALPVEIAALGHPAAISSSTSGVSDGKTPRD